jgi:hypothetical protein
MRLEPLISHTGILMTFYINNSRFAEFLPLIYPPELEVKETIDTPSSKYPQRHQRNLKYLYIDIFSSSSTHYIVKISIE